MVMHGHSPRLPSADGIPPDPQSADFLDRNRIGIENRMREILAGSDVTASVAATSYQTYLGSSLIGVTAAG